LSSTLSFDFLFISPYNLSFLFHFLFCLAFCISPFVILHRLSPYFSSFHSLFPFCLSPVSPPLLFSLHGTKLVSMTHTAPTALLHTAVGSPEFRPTL
jgi:hypothetical protein